MAAIIGPVHTSTRARNAKYCTSITCGAAFQSSPTKSGANFYAQEVAAVKFGVHAVW